MSSQFDIVIVGGGLVGASLACALRDGPFSVALIESARPAPVRAPGYDDRTLALAYGSRRILEGIGVWDTIARRGAAPIRRIHVSERGRFGAARLCAEDLGLEALGYVVSAPLLGGVLYEALGDNPRVTLFCPATVRDLALGPEAAQVTVEAESGERRLRARLVIAADGAESPMRAAAGIGAERIDYGQTAVVTAATPARAHGYTAYERFTPTGPLALLPASAEHCAVVWTVARGQVESMLAWDDETFRARLESAFGERLGRLERVGRRRAFALAFARPRELARARFVLMGNAAHTVHPVAGQGFNLGLRDVAALYDVLLDAAQEGADIGDPARLARYAAWRAPDNRATAALTHSLIRAFSNDALPLAWARRAGLVAVDLLPGLKRALMRMTSGLAGRQPRLALRGARRAP